MISKIRFLTTCMVAVLLGACVQERPEIILSKKSAVELRAMQSRAFETGDQDKAFRGIIATFQDLGYSILKVEPDAGTVTADKLAQLKMTASAYKRHENRLIVRANAVVKLAPDAIGQQVDDPNFYLQRFFEPLSKALFLQALQVEDADGPAAAKAGESVKAAEDRLKFEEETDRKKAEEEKKKLEQGTQNDGTP